MTDLKLQILRTLSIVDAGATIVAQHHHVV